MFIVKIEFLLEIAECIGEDVCSAKIIKGTNSRRHFSNKRTPDFYIKTGTVAPL